MKYNRVATYEDLRVGDLVGFVKYLVKRFLTPKENSVFAIFFWQVAKTIN